MYESISAQNVRISGRNILFTIFTEKAMVGELGTSFVRSNYCIDSNISFRHCCRLINVHFHANTQRATTMQTE